MHPTQKKLMELSQMYDLRALGLRQVTRMIGETHPQKVKHHMQKLGILSPTPGTPDSAAQSKLLSIPLLGLANCGEAIIFAETTESEILQVSKRVLNIDSEKLFAVQAVGDSMNQADVFGENIEDGDFVIVNPEDKDFKQGDYVLSVINDMANIKKFSQGPKGTIVLISESDKNYPPIYIHPEDMSYYKTSGKVVAVLKKPKRTDSDFTYVKSID